MTEQDLAEVGRQAGVSLPARYVAIIARYPQSLLDMADVYPGPKGKPLQRVGPEHAELYNDAELIRIANLGDPDYKNEIFPSHFFIIGDSGCGDYYAIDTTDEAAPVYMGGSHPSEYGDRGQREPICRSIEQWVEMLGNRKAP